MLACEMATVAWARSRSTAGFSSRPTRNMYRITPNWAMTPRYGATDGGRMNAAASGQTRPSNEGPRRIPPTTSPITGGCPMQRNSRLSSRPVSRTAVRATRTWTRASGLPPTVAESLASGAAGPGATSRPPQESTARNSTMAPTIIAPYINAMWAGEARSLRKPFLGWSFHGVGPSGSKNTSTRFVS